MTVKIYTEETSNLTQFEGLPTPPQVARLMVAEAHPTDTDAVRVYDSTRDDSDVFVLKTQDISEIQDEAGQFLAGDLGMDRAAVLDYLNNVVFSVADHDLITSMFGPTGADGLPADYNYVVVDKATGEVKTIVPQDVIVPE